MRLVLVHSPYLGPSSWRPTADRLSADGHVVEVPDLRSSAVQESCARSFIAAVRSVARAGSDDVVLIGHSRAGPLLPAVDQGQRRVAAVMFVDAPLPHPGLSWADVSPPERVDAMRRLGAEPRLPRWSDWWDASVIEELVPDPAMRAALVDEQPRVPRSFLDERLPDDAWPGAAAYLRLSPAYDADAVTARRAGWPVAVRALDHLATLTAPAEVAAAIEELLQRLQLLDAEVEPGRHGA